MPSNNALAVNSVVGQQANLQITTHGSDWYFAVCAIMGFSTLGFMGMAYTKPQGHRIFNYLTAAITATACISYFCMGSNLGQVPIQVQFIRPNSRQVGAAGTREIFYVRYIDWFITTPLLLTDLLLTAGIPWPTLIAVLFADIAMIVTGLVGALTQTRYKWGFWTFGMFGLFYIIYELIGPARRHASALGDGPSKTFLMCGVLLSFLWFLYPIAWGLGEGGNVIHPDSEAIFYGILDVIAKPVWGALLLWGHRNITPQQLGLHIHDNTNPNSAVTEKGRGPHGAHGGTPDGPATTAGANGTPATAGAAGATV
ncbi:Bacteriorhodopsin [Apiospora saccharicola]|uniref:Bacteriorhodopsin n=1 Tax=Apiospora saccharicola TaxID=335842 RepID=A0ABR1VSL0_9PEZI